MNKKLKLEIEKYIKKPENKTVLFCDNGIKKAIFKANDTSIPQYYSYSIQSFIRSGKIQKPFFYSSLFCGSHNPKDLLNSLS